MPDRSLTCSRAGVPPCPPNQPGFIDLMSLVAEFSDRAPVVLSGIAEDGLRLRRLGQSYRTIQGWGHLTKRKKSCAKAHSLSCSSRLVVS